VAVYRTPSDPGVLSQTKMGHRSPPLGEKDTCACIQNTPLGFCNAGVLGGLIILASHGTI